MKLTLSLLMLGAVSVTAELPAKFVKAINQVEASGRTGAILGDNGKAFGPLQIHRACWQDSKVKGVYPDDCASLSYSQRVMLAYFRRYCPVAVEKNDFETMARVWNGGMNGHKSKATIQYWQKVKKHL